MFCFRAAHATPKTWPSGEQVRSGRRLWVSGVQVG
jgi:hypothetical protein